MADPERVSVVTKRRGISFTTSLSFISTTLAKLSCEVGEISETHQKELAKLREENRQLTAQLQKHGRHSKTNTPVAGNGHSFALREGALASVGSFERGNFALQACDDRLESERIAEGFDESESESLEAVVLHEWKALAHQSKLQKQSGQGIASKGSEGSSSCSTQMQTDNDFTNIPSEVTRHFQAKRHDAEIKALCMPGVAKHSRNVDSYKVLHYGAAAYIPHEAEDRCALQEALEPLQASPFFPYVDEHSEQSQVPDSPVNDRQYWLLKDGSTSFDYSYSSGQMQHLTASTKSLDSKPQLPSSACTNAFPRAPVTLPRFEVCKRLDVIAGQRHGYENCTSRTLQMSKTMESIAETPARQEEEKEEKPCFQLPFPPTSSFKLAWEFLGVLLLVYDMVTIPLQAFSVPANMFMWVMSWLILTYWCSDLILTFFVGYYTLDGELIMSFKPIAKHYFFTWFFPDLGIISVDVVSLLINIIVYGSRAFEFGVEEEGQQSNLGILRIGKALRVLRLVRLVRIMKLSQSNFMEILQEKIMSELVFAVINILNNMLVLIFICHGCACFFYLVGTQSFSGYTNWTTAYGYDKLGWFDCYLTSLHWALAIFANGEIIIDPQSIPERFVSIFVLLGSMMFFSAFLGIVGNIVQHLLHRGSKRRSDQWVLRVYLKQIGITWDLKMRVKRYINVLMALSSNQVSKADVYYISLLSKPLQMELLTEQYLTHFTVHPFFNLLSKRSFNLIKDLCCSAVKEARLSQRDTLFSGGETVDTMYFVYRGSLTYVQSTSSSNPNTSSKFYRDSNATTKLECNDWFCEAALWTERWLTCGTVGANTDSELVGMIAEHFLITLQRFQVNMQFPREYAQAFVKGLNESIQRMGVKALTDVTERFPEVDELLATYGGLTRERTLRSSTLQNTRGGLRTPISQVAAVFSDWTGGTK